MPNENKDSVTFERLKQYLKSAGFNRSLAMENTIAFHHEESGVIVTLTVPEDLSLIHISEPTRPY